MIVEFSNEAEGDLEQIGDFIARDNPRSAYSFIRELRNSCDALAQVTEIFPVMLRYDQQGYRRRVHGIYLIFYRVNGDRVSINRVLHVAMDYAAQLGED